MTERVNGMRVALVSAFPPGMQSLNEYGLHLAKGFAERDDVERVIVIADKLPADMSEPELDLGPKVEVRRVWSFNSPWAGFSILSALRAAKADGAVFNIQTATFGDREIPAALGLMTPAAARLAGTPSGVIAHNLIGGIDLEQTQLKGQRLRQAIVRFGGAVVTRALTSASYVTVTLESYRDILAQVAKSADVTHVAHGTFDTGVNSVSPAATRPQRIVTMGKFGTYKKLETLLAAFDILRRRPGFAQAELVIGGTDHPNAQGYVQSLADSRKGDAGVHFHGYVAEDDIPAFFQDARVSVFDYSATTGSSGVLHQTASYGAVPVFPHIGDFVDVCRNEGIEGEHYAPGDAEGMARAIESFLADPERSDRVAAANLAAAHGMPFSEVIDFHMKKIAALRPIQQSETAKELHPSIVR